MARLPGDGCEVGPGGEQPRCDGPPGVMRRARPHPGAARDHAKPSVDRARREPCRADPSARRHGIEERTLLGAALPNPRVEVARGLGRELCAARPTPFGDPHREHASRRRVVPDVEGGNLGAPRTGREGDREKREVALAERRRQTPRLREHPGKLGVREGSPGRERATARAVHVADVVEVLRRHEPQPTAVPEEAPDGCERDVDRRDRIAALDELSLQQLNVVVADVLPREVGEDGAAA